ALIKRAGLVTLSIGPLIPTAGLDADTVNTRVAEWIEAEMRRLDPDAYPAETVETAETAETAETSGTAPAQTPRRRAPTPPRPQP
ncbi:MAG: hypothetical protein ACRYGL_01690, partial [Janthinobacterium lividum]